MFARLVFLTALLAVLLPNTSHADERFTDPFGGDGGQQFISRCAPGAKLTGVATLMGAYINHIAPICDGRVMPGAGGGGRQNNASCPAGSAVQSIFVMSLRSPNHLLKLMALNCYSRPGGTQTATVWVNTPGKTTRPFNPLLTNRDYPYKTIDCGAQTIGGLQGRAGDSIDALGLVCR